MPSIALIHPPLVKACEPPPGIARLKAALDTASVPAWTVDANLEGQLWLLARLAGRPGLADSADTWTRRAVRGLERNLAALRDPASYTTDGADGIPSGRYLRAVSDLGRVLTLAGPDWRVTLSDCRHATLSPVRSADLATAHAHPESSPFHDYFAGPLTERLAGLNPTHIGISLSFLSQALAAFSLIGLLRARFPDKRIVLGGGLVTSWLRGPTQGAPLRPYADHIVSGPGEAAIIGLLTDRTAGFKSPPAPDFSGLPLADYLSPGPVIPYNASTGCWWRKCSFCPEKAEGGPYRPVPAMQAAAQLRDLTTRHRPALLHLTDNAIPPALLRELTRRPPGAPWYGFSRTLPILADPAFCRDLRAAGCVMLKLGLESGHDAVLTRMGKGADTTLAVRALHALRQAGIAVYAYLLFGTPDESEAEAARTLEFAAAQADRLTCLNLAIFNMPLNAPEATGHPVFYEGDLSLYADFKHPADFDRARVRRFLDRGLKRHPAIAAILRRDPPQFTSNHAAFFSIRH